MSFKDLKAKRDVKGKQSVLKTSEDVQGIPEGQQGEVSDPYELKRTSLRLGTSTLGGRGLFSQTETKPGYKLLSLQPHIHAVSARFLECNCTLCTSEENVRRCTRCKKVAYCSTECQKADWVIHKQECPALRRWTEASGVDATPADSIRAISRLLWMRNIKGKDSTWWRQIDAMQSNRESLSLSTQESYTHLAQSLVLYMKLESPEGLREYGIESGKDLVELMSKFTTNSFTLTSPLLNAIGVAISPTPALINHSCHPNAVAVFPAIRKGFSPTLEVIALRAIHPGEEILAAYVDITLPREIRQKSLQETYAFDCSCTSCTQIAGTLDLRECIFCSKCSEGFVPNQQGARASCSKCGTNPSISTNVQERIRLGTEGLEKAERLQWTDSEDSLRLTTNLNTLLAPDLPPTSHPRLALMRLNHTLLLERLNLDPKESNPSSSSSLDDIIKLGTQIVAALVDLLPYGHPTRVVAITGLARLLRVDEREDQSSDRPTSTFPPHGYQRLVLAKETLLRALAEVNIGLPGGALLEGVRGLLDDTDRELAVFKRGVRNVQANAVAMKG